MESCEEQQVADSLMIAGLGEETQEPGPDAPLRRFLGPGELWQAVVQVHFSQL